MPTSKMCLLLKLLEVFFPSRNLSTDLKSLNHTESLGFSSKQPTEEKRNCVMLLCFQSNLVQESETTSHLTNILSTQ